VILKELRDVFRCPDDGHKLVMGKESFKCESCERTFPIYAENVVELLPIKPYHFDQGSVMEYYLTAYNRLLHDKFEWNPSSKGWGSLSTYPRGFRVGFNEERKLIERYLGERVSGLLCDVSGGAGVFSSHFTKIGNPVLHCDIAVGSINEAYEQSKQHNLGKILLVRCDYLQMPFASDTFDSVICTGHTTGHGLAHDARLLMEIIRCLKPQGRFVVDFPNKSRVPPLLSLLFRIRINSNAYNRSVLQQILIEINHKSVKCIGYVPSKLVLFEKAYTPLDKMFQMLRVPPSTYVVFGQKD